MLRLAACPQRAIRQLADFSAKLCLNALLTGHRAVKTSLETMNAPQSPLSADIEAALEWWRMAGVDHDYSEDVTDWLAKADAQAKPAQPSTVPQQAPSEPQAEPAKIARTNLLGDVPPSDLAAFQQFWLEAPGLDAIGPRGRVAARGPANAELMVLVTDPEEHDGARLLNGPQGQLLSRILAAMGYEESDVYVASALPRHTPMADTAAIAAAGMDAVVLHHISLAAPKRLIALGSNILPLLGHRLPKDASSLREINQNQVITPILVSEGLTDFMSMPLLKARFWRRYLEWSANL